MGPGVAGLGTARIPAASPRWRERFERTWGVVLPAATPALDAELARCLGELEAGLARIDFAEVTDADRVAFLEHVVSWQVRRALGAGRFDLAHAVIAQGRRAIADIVARTRGWRPILVPGRAGVRTSHDVPASGPGTGAA